MSCTFNPITLVPISNWKLDDKLEYDMSKAFYAQENY